MNVNIYTGDEAPTIDNSTRRCIECGEVLEPYERVLCNNCFSTDNGEVEELNFDDERRW